MGMFSNGPTDHILGWWASAVDNVMSCEDFFNEYFTIENKWGWIGARAFWCQSPADLGGIARDVTFVLASLSGLFMSVFSMQSMDGIEELNAKTWQWPLELSENQVFMFF